MDSDKTVAMGQGGPFSGFGKCPVCGGDYVPDFSGSGSLRCSVCGLCVKRSEMLEPGSNIGKYKILSHLNSGGCGDLFLCAPLDDFQTRYVLKVMKETDGAGRKRFEREASILSRIRNERIAQVVDFWGEGEDRFIVMEYVKGKDLREIREEFAFSEETSLQIIRETALALQYAWEQYFVIHRDIKPENIMLDDKNHLKLMDFGLSKQISSCETAGVTMAHSGLGTPGYMSPEQFLDFKNVDFRSDIFSLGATMFYLITGTKPFSGKDARAIYEDTLRNSPPPFQKLASKCSRDCILLIRRMMQRDPEKRFQTYTELLNEIGRILSGLK